MGSSVVTLIEQGQLADREGRRDDARALFERALYALRDRSDASLASALLRWIARTHEAEGNPAAAIDSIEAAVAVAELSQDHGAIGNAINVEAIFRLQGGELETAEALFGRARESGRAGGEMLLGARAALNLGVIANVRGDLEKTLRYYRTGISELRSLGATKDVCTGLNNMGMLFTDLERWVEAEQAYDEALQIATDTGDIATRIILEGNRAELFIARGMIDEAQNACDRAVELSGQTKSRKTDAEIHKHLGTIARHRGDLASAEEHLGEAQRIASDRRDVLLSAETAREQAELYRRLGRNRDSLMYFNKSHRLFSELSAKRDIADVNRRTSRLESHFLDVVRHWAGSIESKDRYTQGHCERVADIACALAVRIGLDPAELFWFRIGAMIHDVGKLIIPGEVLNKPGKLSPDEWELVRRHPVTGVEMLADIDFPGDVIPMVRWHHERWDGTGYPDRIGGTDIPRAARILCIADVYDALTSRRSYKSALTHDKAMDIMRHDIGTQFDPDIFPEFEELMRTRQPALRARSNGEARNAAPPALTDLAVPGQRDDLTGLVTRRPFAENATTILRDRGAFAAVSLLVVDVDLFKKVNDQHGHLQGDAVLRAVALVLREQVGDAGLVGRYAGDEFVVLLTHAGAAEAREVGERLRDALRRTEVEGRDGGDKTHVTVSIGIATANPEHRDFEALFSAADVALYEAKRRGRDTVVGAEGDEEDANEATVNLKQFVGRDDEVHRLMRLLESCVENGAHVVAIIGEAGVGKSTLVRQLAPEVRLRAGALVDGRCLEADAKPPYAPWAEVISALHQMGSVADREWLELPRIVPGLGRPSPNRSGDRYTLFDEIAEYLRLAAASRPLVIVLDDMQWADSASWDVLEHLMPRMELERLLICLTLRSEDVRGPVLERRHRLSRDERYHEINVPRLSDGEMRQWVSNVFGGRPADAELVSYLRRISEGNPLLATQVLRVLLDDRALRVTSGRWEFRADARVQLPAAIAGLMDRRLERLSPDARRILMTAAVIGRTFDIDLAVAAGAGSEDELLDAVDEAIAHAVLEPTDGGSSGVFSFTHALLVEAVKRGANPRRLARIHARVAEAMESQSAPNLAAIAVHYDRAGVHDKAYAYTMAAGSAAVSVYAHTEAREFFEIAVRTADSNLARVRALRELASVEEVEGRTARTESLCEEALRLLERCDDNADALPLRRMRARMRMLHGQPPQPTISECQTLLHDAIAREERGEEASLLMMISQCHGRLGDLAEARNVAQRAVDAAERGQSVKLHAETLTRLGTTMMEANDDGAARTYHRAQELFRTVGDRAGEARCSINLGILSQRAGDGSEAEEMYEKALATARAAHAGDLVGLAALNLGVLCLRRGNTDQARTHFDEALVRFTDSKNEPHRLAALYNMAQLTAEVGEWRMAASIYEDVAQLAARIGQTDVALGARAGQGLLSLALGERLSADDAMRTLRAQLDARPSWWFQGRELVDTLRVRLTSDRGDSAYALRILRESADMAAAHDMFAAAHMVAACAPSLLTCGGPLLGLVERFIPHVEALGFTGVAGRLTAARAALVDRQTPTAA